MEVVNTANVSQAMCLCRAGPFDETHRGCWWPDLNAVEGKAVVLAATGPRHQMGLPRFQHKMWYCVIIDVFACVVQTFGAFRAAMNFPSSSGSPSSSVMSTPSPASSLALFASPSAIQLICSIADLSSDGLAFLSQRPSVVQPVSNVPFDV